MEGITDPDLVALRPDLVVRDESNKSIVIVDVTVPFENRKIGFEAARREKISKYTPLAMALQAQGYSVVIDAIIVGTLGTWDPRNERVLRMLSISQVYATMMRRLIISETLHWSRDIYVEHVSGVRQYRLAEP